MFLHYFQFLAQFSVWLFNYDWTCCPSRISSPFFFFFNSSWKGAIISAWENAYDTWFTNPNQDSLSESYSVLCHPKSSKCHLLFHKVKFLWVEDDTIVATVGDVVYRIPEECFSEYGVINTSGFSGHINIDFIESACIHVSWCMESLWVLIIAVSAPFCNEGSCISCQQGEGESVVAIPCI